MKNMLLLIMILFAAVSFSACSGKQNVSIPQRFDQLESRIEKLENRMDKIESVQQKAEEEKKADVSKKKKDHWPAVTHSNKVGGGDFPAVTHSK